MTVGLADLAREIVHVGIEPHVQQNRRIDLARLGVSRGVIEKRGEIVQERDEDTNRRFVDRDGHHLAPDRSTAE